MPQDEFIEQRAGQRGRNLLLQELRESCERARLGGFFYPVAALLAFFAAGAGAWRWQAVAVVGGLLALAIARCLIGPSAAPDIGEARRKLRLLWAVVLGSTILWGAFSAWTFAALTEPAPLVALLFSGAFGMALAHTMCMRTTPAVLAILCVMVPSQWVLWQGASQWVAIMWGVYMLYMLMVLRRSHREYRARLELEEDLRQQRDLFERQSQVDGLTGIANRREFGAALVRAVDGAAPGRAVSLLIIDVDHFKRINDSLGHRAGDACLVALAERLREHFREPGDLPVRLGGEEFGVVIQADRPQASQRAERFREALAAQPVQALDREVAVTVSIGCGQFDPARHEDADAFYGDVDAALYRAKLAGRNRTEHA
ncbi:GGDEF domain-containing protein [Luteimonas kalidii]|uniref:diguanylate cyclase n=1 Tax=Luteimonas kalidii TaxID=3042025 RepID=A0ABT6JV96_9GAMM|nr:GGDEF domain-containing protein [Luteimonas kalidii]MDH5834605.1 GGDEF domain-containing protein [Luteimonas kalidii]